MQAYKVKKSCFQQIFDSSESIYKHNDRPQQNPPLISPDCSAVIQCNNLNDANQLSWLEKFAQDNNASTNSRFFQQKKEFSPQKQADQMKFSFNRNVGNQGKEIFGQGHRWNAESTRRIQQLEGFDRKFQSIKLDRLPSINKHSNQASLRRNSSIKKQADESISISKKSFNFSANQTEELLKLSQIEKRLDQVIFQDRFKNKEVQMVTTKEDLEWIPLKYDSDFNSALKNRMKEGNLYIANKQQTLKLEDNLQKKRRFGQAGLVNGKIQTMSHRKMPTFSNTSNESQQNTVKNNQLVHTVEKLFIKLDVRRLNRLSKTNCNLQNLAEDVKLVLGPIFSKIKIKNIDINLQEFIRLCEQTLAEYDWDQIKHTLIDQSHCPARGGRLKRTISKYQSQPPNWKGDRLQNQESQYSAKSKQLQAQNYNLPNYAGQSHKSLFKIQQNLTQKRRIGSICNIASQINKNPYVNLDQTLVISEHQKKSSLQNKALANVQKRAKVPYMPMSDLKQGNIVKKKNREQIDKLNTRLERYLVKNDVNRKKGGALKENRDQLAFTELIKHI